MSITRRSLPEFDHPPAVETLMGYHFAPMAEWGVLRLGQFWEVLKDAYPTAIVNPPIENGFIAQSETDWNRLPLRAMFTSADKGEVLQVQNTAFLRNWRKTIDNRGYTHYANLKPKFEEDWNTFINFLMARHIPLPDVFICEVTYVNHLVRGKDWDSYGDLARLIKFFAPRVEISASGRSYEYLPDAAKVGLFLGYSLPDTGITLEYSAQSAVDMTEGTEVLQLTITAKGTPIGPRPQSLGNLLDACHDAVILGFDDATTAVAHERWGKR